MKRISSSGASVFELLLMLAVICLSLYYGMNALMPDSVAPSQPEQFKQADLPVLANDGANALNAKNDEQQRAIEEMLGKKQ